MLCKMNLSFVSMHSWTAAQLWPGQVKFALTAFAVAIATIVELPESFDAPGKPFLLYFIMSSLCALASGLRFGLLAIGASSFLSVIFFEPVYTFWLSNRKDLLEIVAFAAVGSAGVLALGGIRAALESRERQTSHLMLSEMAHRVANNFASAGAILRRASTTVHNCDARRALDDALNQLHIFASIHSQLHPGRNGDQRVDSREFIGSLCTALEKTAAGTAHLRFEHLGIGVALPLAQAVGVGLIINELVTNSAKYAFPAEREGWITVTLTVHGDECQVCVADNGVGKVAKGQGSGRGLGLAEGLTEQLGGSFSLESSTEGTQGKIRFRIKGKQIEVDNRRLACV